MMLGLFQKVVELNASFDRLMTRLKRLESVPYFQRDLIQHARSDLEIVLVDANREFFDNFEALVEDDAWWAYRFQREHKQKTKDSDDDYFDIEDSEERRKKNGLPLRIVIFPDRDFNDEERYDEEQAAKKKRGARTKAAALNRRRVSPAKGKKRAQFVVATASEGEGQQ
jgi:hypothetical protein